MQQINNETKVQLNNVSTLRLTHFAMIMFTELNNLLNFSAREQSYPSSRLDGVPQGEMLSVDVTFNPVRGC